MAFFTIRSAPVGGREEIKATAVFLGLRNVGDDVYELPNGNRLKLRKDQDGYALEPLATDKT